MTTSTPLRQLAADAYARRADLRPRYDAHGLPAETSALYAEFVMRQPEPDDIWEPVKIEWNCVHLADNVILWRDFERGQWLYHMADGTFYPVSSLADLGEALAISDDHTAAVEQRRAYLQAQYDRIHAADAAAAARAMADNRTVRVYVDRWGNHTGFWDKLAETAD